MKYKLEENYEPFSGIQELFENDNYLLSLLVFLEAYKENKDQIRLSEITKNINWTYEDFHDCLPVVTASITICRVLVPAIIR